MGISRGLPAICKNNMTEADYLYECSRAELLGFPKPSKDEFFSKQKEFTVKGSAEEEEITAEQGEDAEAKREELRRIGGGLDELNSILCNTQKKLNRFKTVCGSFSNLLKLQIGAKKEENESPVDLNINFAKENEGGIEETKKFVLDSPQVQIKKGGDSQLDKLDSLISKAERAELSLCSQNKQMKKFLK